MMESSLLADLITELPNAVRLQRLVHTLREHFNCGAVGLLRLDGDSLRPLATVGLVHEALGRRFVIAQHPRLAAIMASREPTWFEPDSRLPDPYDGLLDAHVGEPLPVHDCMGVSLYVEGQQWGALTLDALHAGTFDSKARRDLQRYVLMVEAAVRVTRLEQENRSLRLARSDVKTAALVTEESEILGHSQVIHQLLSELEVVAASELPVLLLGETGVGKELFARHLHRLSWPNSSLSATSRAPFPAPPPIAPGASMRPMAAPCCSTRWASCPSAYRPSCCAPCRMARSSAWVRTSRCMWTCASSPRPTATCRTAFATGISARTSTIACRCIRYRFRRCASAATMC